MSYRFEWFAGPVLLGAAVLVLIVPSFALMGLAIVALVVVAAVVALAGAVLAMPYLLVRSLHRRLATKQSGVAALANTTTARASR